MSDSKFDPLDTALAALPRDIKLESDLWPAIRAELEVNSLTSKRGTSLGIMGQLAAGVVLVIASSMTTYLFMRAPTATHATIAETVPASYGVLPINFDSNTLGPGYKKARADLESVFASRIASLPPATRAKLLNNLADLRRANEEITATLSQHPADPLLQELLLSTQQRELQLLADVDQLTIPNLQRTET